MDAWHLRVSDDQLDQLNIRAKFRLSQLMVVLTGTYQRKSISEIARQLSCTRELVIWMQHVLLLRTQRGRRKWERGTKNPPCPETEEGA